MKKTSGQALNPQPQKRLGQHFLCSKKALKTIIEAANLNSKDIVLEIGPGQGVLTKELAQKTRRVIVVEKDPGLIDVLKENLKENNNVKVINQDIRELMPDIGRLISKTTSSLSSAKYKVVANLPYYLASHIIRQLLENKTKPGLMVLMVQKEVGKRICSQPGQMSLLGVSVQFYAKVELVGYVSKNAFWPKPKVDAAIIKVEPLINVDKKPINADLFFKIVKAGFSQPRKKLINNFSRGLNLEKEQVVNWFKKSNLDPNCRAQDLCLQDWLKLSNSCLFIIL